MPDAPVTGPHFAGIVAGDPDAFASWVAGAEPRLRGSLARFAEHVDCEAVLQESLLRVWQVAPRIRPDGRSEPLMRVAIRIARNLAVSELRRLRVRPQIIDDLARDLPEPATEPATPDPMLRSAIALCRERLPKKPAQALHARLNDTGRRDADLAQELGMKLNTFLQNFTRARRLLSDCLAQHGIDVARELR